MTLQLGTPQTIWDSTHPGSTGGKQSEFRTLGSTARKLSTREIVYVISYGPQIYVSSTWDAPELRTTNREIVNVISYGPQIYVSSTWDAPELRTTKSRYTRALHHGNSD